MRHKVSSKAFWRFTYQQSSHSDVQWILCTNGAAFLNWVVDRLGLDWDVEVNGSKGLAKFPRNRMIGSREVVWQGCLFGLLTLLWHSGRFAKKWCLDGWVHWPRAGINFRLSDSLLISGGVGACVGELALALSFVALEDVLAVVANTTVFAFEWSIS